MSLENKEYELNGFDRFIEEGQEYMSDEFGGEVEEEQEYMSDEFDGEVEEGQEYMSDEFDGEVEEGQEYMSDEFGGEVEELDAYMGEEGARVLFGNINPLEANVSPTKVWNVADKSLGLFFIVDADEEVMSKGIQVLTKDNVQIWSSPIKKLPKDSLVLEGIEGDIYISARAISRVELEEEVSGNYVVMVDDSDVQAMVLKIEGLSKNDDLVEDDNFDVESNGNENVFANMDEPVMEQTRGELAKPIIEQQGVDDTASEVDHGLEVLRVGLNTGSFTSRVVKKDENGNMLNMFGTVCINPEDSLFGKVKGADIVIEKINNKYIVTLNNVAKRPIQLFDGESPYFVHGEKAIDSTNINDFIGKVKTVVCRTYGLEPVEFDEMKKAFITDNLILQIPGESVDVPIDSRVCVLNEFPIKKGHAIIDLGQDGCDIYYRTDKDVLVVSCFSLGEKELVSLYEDLNKLVGLLGKENVELLGLPANEEVFNILKRENDDCGINTLAKLVRM